MTCLVAVFFLFLVLEFIELGCVGFWFSSDLEIFPISSSHTFPVPTLLSSPLRIPVLLYIWLVEAVSRLTDGFCLFFF